ncbi:MAG TPA: hypothetical protein VGB82_23900 [Alphaproteobacteria bacterium]
MIRYHLLIVMAAAVVAGLMMVARQAWPHGDAQWIQQGGYRSPSGIFCCGVSDCRPLPDKSVRPVSTGYAIRVDAETGDGETGEEGEVVAPYERFLPSEDDHFWVCGGMTPEQWRCLFAPPMGV